MSEQASHTGADTAASTVAPSLPEPAIADSNSVPALLSAARSALALGHTGEAQQAIEMAQTRLLDRSVPQFQTNQPSTNPAVALLGNAIRALGAGDRPKAMQYLDEALPLARQMTDAK